VWTIFSELQPNVLHGRAWALRDHARVDIIAANYSSTDDLGADNLSADDLGTNDPGANSCHVQPL